MAVAMEPVDRKIRARQADALAPCDGRAFTVSGTQPIRSGRTRSWVHGGWTHSTFGEPTSERRVCRRPGAPWCVRVPWEAGSVHPGRVGLRPPRGCGRPALMSGIALSLPWRRRQADGPLGPFPPRHSVCAVGNHHCTSSGLPWARRGLHNPVRSAAGVAQQRAADQARQRREPPARSAYPLRRTGWRRAGPTGSYSARRRGPPVLNRGAGSGATSGGRGCGGGGDGVLVTGASVSTGTGAGSGASVGGSTAAGRLAAGAGACTAAGGPAGGPAGSRAGLNREATANNPRARIPTDSSKPPRRIPISGPSQRAGSAAPFGSRITGSDRRTLATAASAAPACGS
jgi:hypothetical protein